MNTEPEKADDMRAGSAEFHAEAVAEPIRRLKLFGREFALPRSRAMRIALGVLLIVLGIFGFLPVLGFWMIPLGLLVLSYEFPAIRRRRRRFSLWWARRRSRQAR